MRPGVIALAPIFRRAIGTPKRMNSEGIENVTIRGNEA
jgi:hypothetical protein